MIFLMNKSAMLTKIVKKEGKKREKNLIYVIKAQRVKDINISRYTLIDSIDSIHPPLEQMRKIRRTSSKNSRQINANETYISEIKIFVWKNFLFFTLKAFWKSFLSSYYTFFCSLCCSNPIKFHCFNLTPHWS